MAKNNNLKKFRLARENFLKLPACDRINVVVGFLRDECLDVETFLKACRQNDDNNHYAIKALEKFGLKWTPRNRKSLFALMRLKRQEISESVNTLMNKNVPTYQNVNERELEVNIDSSTDSCQTQIFDSNMNKKLKLSITKTCMDILNKEIDESKIVDINLVCLNDLSTKKRDTEVSFDKRGNQDVLSTSDICNELVDKKKSNVDMMAEELMSDKSNPVTVVFDVQADHHYNKCDSIKTKPTSERPSFRHCSHCIGSFDIDIVTWKKMVNEDGTKLITSVYPQVIAQKFYGITKGCVIQINSFYYQSKKATRPFTVYAYCGHCYKTSFKLFIHYDKVTGNVNVSVYSNVLTCFHEEPKTRHLSGIDRVDMVNRLRQGKPKLVRLEMIKNSDDKGIMLKNLQNVKSASVFRKAKAEFLAANDLHKDPLIDLFLLRNEETDSSKRYIQHVSHPFQVVLYREDTLAVAIAAKLRAKKIKDDFIVHIDATGTVVRKIDQCNDKRVYYYAVVFRYDSKILPLSEYISCMHSTPYIENWLSMLKAHILEHTELPLFNKVVMDFSWPLIHAVTHTFNRMHINAYLDACYDIVSGNNVKYLPIVTLHLCVCHFVKMCINDVKEAKSSIAKCHQKDFKDMVMQVICNLIQCTSYDKVKLIAKEFLLVLMTQHEGAVLKTGMSRLSDLCSRINVEDMMVEDISDLEPPKENADSRKHIYSRSPFFKDIEQIQQSLITVDFDATDSSEEEYTKVNDKTCTKFQNKFYNPVMVEIFVKKLAPYLPMWSSILMRNQRNVKRLSNAPVENWFGLLKHTILESERNLRPNRFILKTKDYIESTVKEIKLNIPTEGCARGKKKRKYVKPATGKTPKTQNITSTPTIILDDVLDNTDTVEESWKKKIPTTNTYFNSNYLTSIAKPVFTIPEIAENKIKSLVMSNGLIADPSYYIDVKVQNISGYYICTFKSVTGNLYHGTNLILNELQGESWLSSFLMELVFFMFNKIYSSSDSVIFSDYIGTTAIIKNELIDKDHFMLKDTPITNSTNRFFFPIHVPLHWVLAYANWEKKQFSFIDSLYAVTDIDTVTKYMNNFLKFMKITFGKHTDVNEWSIKTISHPKQVDSYNCGIHVINNTEQLLTRDEISPHVDCSFYRERLYNLLLRHSESMENYCPSCSQQHNPRGPVLKEHECVQCNTCSRWYHVYQQCLPSDIPKDIELLNKPNIKVYCNLCRHYYKCKLQ